MADISLGSLESWLLGARTVMLLAAFATFAWALMRMRREATEQLDKVQNAQRELATQNLALHERLAALSTLVATLPRRIDLPVETPRDPAPQRREHAVPSYETAKRLARSGASVEEIVASCGVAGTEARLLRRLHGADARRNNVA